MTIRRDIAFSPVEPPKQYLWIGKKDDAYFIRIWNGGWKDITGYNGGLVINSGDGISVTKDSEGWHIGLKDSVMESISNIEKFINDFSIATAEEIDKILIYNGL